MSDLAGAPASTGPVRSPCTGVCRIQPASGWCEGCWRSLDEIAAWSRMDDTARRQVWQQIGLRRAGASQGGTPPGPTRA